MPSIFEGARKMKPTQRHRNAIWECMLGTVYAQNDAAEIKYFDYDWDAARKFAGVDEPGRDPRVAKDQRGSARHDGPRKGQSVLYVIKR
jgi:hypothetical protein